MKYFFKLSIVLALYIVLFFLSRRFKGPEDTSDEEGEQKELDFENPSDVDSSFNNEETNTLSTTTNFFDPVNEVCEGSYRKFDNLVTALDNYIQRYINLFLIASDLANYEINNSEKIINVDLQITISAEDLAFLQNYSKIEKDSSRLRSLSKLDAIFSNVTKKVDKNYWEEALKLSASFSINVIYTVFSDPNFLHCLPFLVILFLVSFCYSHISNNLYTCLGVLCNSMILWDSVVLYWKRIKELNLEIYVKKMQMIPEDCDPVASPWYRKFISAFWQNDCVDHYKTMLKNPLEEITLLHCIVETYFFYLFEFPAKTIGTAVRVYTGQIQILWPWPFNYFINIGLIPLFTLFLVVVLLILCGKKIRLSFLWSSVEIGDARSSTANGEALTSSRTSKRKRDNRKLRPWTKPRFSRQASALLLRRLPMKAARSLNDLPGVADQLEDASTSSDAADGPESQPVQNEVRNKTELSE